MQSNPPLSNNSSNSNGSFNNLNMDFYNSNNTEMNNGGTMGMGGGFYDTTLAKSYQYSSSQNHRRHPLRVGWCHEFQVFDELETQPWDVPLNALITPEKIRWFS